jgi:pimeloyl-ACP methyl ester carboxylesterase
LQAVAWLAPLFREVLKERDLIFFDQRGVGYSEPSLNCPEFEQILLVHIEESLNELEQHSLGAEAMAACRERLIDGGIDLSAYNSATSAADLNDLRRALGYETWNLYGVSYGTKLALTTMREFEESSTIRSVILDSVYPPQVAGNADWGVNADNAFKIIFERCAAIEDCNNDYPDLETRFYDLVDALNNKPINIIVTDRVNRTTFQTPFDGDDLIQTFFQMAYESDRIIYLPKMIRQLENGVSLILAEFLTDNLYEALNISEGMYTSVQCYEETPFISAAEVENAAKNLPPRLGHVFELTGLYGLEICETWHGVTADPIENAPVVSDIPTLILAGYYDPITPPSYGLETAEFLNNHFYFEFKGESHGVAFSHNCGMAILAAFLDQPQVSPDAGCMASLYIGFVPY